MNMVALKSVIDHAVREQLAPVVVEDVLVNPRRDSNDEDAIFVTVKVALQTPVLQGDAMIAAVVAVSDALQRPGETRFPYLMIHRTGEVSPIEDRDVDP